MVPGKRPTWDEVRAVQRMLEGTFKARVVAKKDDLLMQVLAWGIARANEKLPPGILPMTSEDFLTKWAMTIGATVYMPVVQDPFEYLLLLLHEVGHVLQHAGASGDASSSTDPYRMATGLAFMQLYVTGDLRDPRTLREFCAHVEADAEAVRCEGFHLFTGSVMPVADALAPLHGPAYLLRDEDVDLAHGILNSRSTSIRYGTYLSPVTRAVKALCAVSFPHLLAA